uniref:Uncharacterized protein n=1 Tax=Picea sitchensis TaxID=3332 RepID=A9P2G7_PICSI|nr:unknown [Picea sitchensis]
MVRGKTQMKRIENASRRQVTFSKRRNGLLKKAYELSVLCDAEVGLMIFSSSGKLHEFASPSMQKMVERHHSTHNTTNEQDNKGLNRKITNMEEKIRILELTQRKMSGEDLRTCSMKELNQLEVQIERGLRHIRARKTEILLGQVEELKRKECLLLEENTFLRKQVLAMNAIGFGSVQYFEVEVETQLDIRPPVCTRSPSCK